VPTWSAARGAWRVRFYGRGTEGVAAGLEPPVERGWLRQVHGCEVVPARAGACGEGDALRVDRAGIAAAIATADCVPLVIAGGEAAVVVHAGWRGIVAGVVGAAAATLAAGGERFAWIGPAIGPCCYEVGEEVAERVAAAADAPEAVLAGAGSRPHLDLHAAVREQLRAAGIAAIERVEACTRCRGEWLWSYRRDGPGAGRNWALLWRSEDG